MTQLTTFRTRQGIIYTVTNKSGWIVLITSNRAVAERVYGELKNQTRDLWLNIQESNAKTRRN
jgi:hypothetical protein